MGRAKDFESELLHFLLGLPQAEIDAALASASEKADEIEEALAAHLDAPQERKTADSVALHYHHRFLQAHSLQGNRNIAEDLAFYMAAIAVTQLAEDVSQAAYNHGRLAELTEEMKAIEEREKLPAGEFWPIGEGPEDYQALTEESDRLHQEFVDSIILEMLQRYRFEQIAKAFEHDRMTYEVRFEVGRRLASQSAGDWLDVDDWTEQRLINNFGAKAYALLRSRLRAAGIKDK